MQYCGRKSGAFCRAELIEWTFSVLVRAGIPDQDALVAAQILIRTDARGVFTHGLSRLRVYIDKLTSGEMAAKPEFQCKTNGAHLAIEAGRALGQVAGPKAVALAIEETRSRPVVACTIRESGHLGALGVLILAAAEANRVALLMQTTQPLLALPGWTSPTLGNNPIAVAAPRPDGPPLVIDLACSVAARGNILLAHKAGRAIPETWALDAEGRPTTDAGAALEGALLPFGGVKGLMIAAMVELLAGSLAGASTGGNMQAAASAPAGVSALLVVFNPELMVGWEAYRSHIQAWTGRLVRAGGAGARLPGENGHHSEQLSEAAGIHLPPSTIADLGELAKRFDLPLPAPAEA